MSNSASPELTKRALTGLAQFHVALALLLFLPAWTLQFWQAWLYLGILAGMTFAITLYLIKKDRALLERRMSAGAGAEGDPAQKRIQLVNSLIVVALYAGAGLDRHFGWTPVPPWLSWAAEIAVVGGLAIVWRVFRENTYTAGTVQVAEGQSVIDTGPYAVVRHPMYTGAILMMLATPLALGSYLALVFAVALVAGIVARIFAEERFLVQGLAGYPEYRSRVRWRLLPGVW